MRKKIPNALYISFILDRDKENSRILPRLHRLLSDAFGEKSTKCMTEGDSKALTREVIYRVSTPVIVNDSVWEEYFKKMLSVFNNTSSFLPHFTSYEEA